MLLGEPPRTAYDLNLSLFGFRIRITPFFWLAAALLGWGPTRGMDGRVDPKLLISWCVAVLISILIHELGHSFAFRYFSTMSHVVLYHFGGVAVPDSHGSSFSTGRSRNPYAQIMISLAGPVAQLTGAVVLIGIIAATGHDVPLVGFLSSIVPQTGAPPLEPKTVLAFALFFLYISVYWALINLLPVYPLDGGQIARELFVLFGRGDGIKNSLLLSLFTGGGVALLAFANQQFYLGMLFGMLAFSSYQVLQAYGGGFGRRW